MIDINTYRSRIGLFSPSNSRNKSVFRQDFSNLFWWNRNTSGKRILLGLQAACKVFLILGLVYPTEASGQALNNYYPMSGRPQPSSFPIGSPPMTVLEEYTPVLKGADHQAAEFRSVSQLLSHGGHAVLVGTHCKAQPRDRHAEEAGNETIGKNEYRKKVNHNFEARYLHGNIKKQKGIVNMHLNIRSLRFKVAEVKQLIKEHNPHIFGISESELDKKVIKEETLKIPGYDILFPKSWSQHGFARILVYVKKSFKYQQVSDLEDERVQSVWLKGAQLNSRGIYYCHGYREHLSREGLAVQQGYLATFLNQWESATVHGGREDPNEVHICGDINIDMYQGRWLQPNYPLLPMSNLIRNSCNVNNLNQLVNEVTRAQYNSISNTTEISCIDHIYTNAKFRCSDPIVISFGDSDHDLIKYTRYSKSPPVPARVICKRSYKDFNKEAFLEDIAATDWSEVYNCEDVDFATEVFTRKFRCILNVHAPWVRVQQRKSFSPWITKETKNLMSLRDQWKKVAKEISMSSRTPCQNQSYAWNQYKKYRNKVNNQKKHEEGKYKAEKLIEVAEAPGIVWKSAKAFMGWKTPGTPSQIKVNNELITSAKKIANHMNDFFIQKVIKIQSAMEATTFSVAKVRDIMEHKTCQAQLSHVNVDKVKKILKNLSSSRSTGIDELDNFSLKLAGDYIAQPIHHIVCLSIIQSKFPCSWKVSKVIPLHKKDDKLERKNYRPVSILSPVSKVLEKVVYEQIYNYFTRNNLFHPNLHGYRGNRSTQTALLQMYDRWVRAAHGDGPGQHGQLSGVVLLDLSAAFDLVDPNLLLQKLEVYGFDKSFLAWVKTYLTDRQQAVWIDHAFSSLKSCPVGVPQGSNLGPLFFLVFYNDLPYSVDCPVDAYADDSTMTVTGRTVEEIGTSLTENCRVVSNWMLKNRLKLNAEKTHLMTVGTGARLRMQDSKVEVVMDGIYLKESNEKYETLLGCNIEPDLKWHKQVYKLQMKLKMRLSALHHLKGMIPFHMKKRITEGIFTSVLSYCLPVFGGCDKGEIESLQVMQNKAARLVTNLGQRASREIIFKQVGWMTVNQLVFYHSALATFRIRQSKEPEYLSKIMNRNNRANKIIIPHTRLSLAKNSYCFRAAAQWNCLPERIRNIIRISPFKVQLRSWVHQNISQFQDP